MRKMQIFFKLFAIFIFSKKIDFSAQGVYITFYIIFRVCSMTFKEYWQSNISDGKSGLRAVLFDVDGTIVSGRNPLPGAQETLNFLDKKHTPYFFLTNDSHHSPAQKASLIAKAGITVDPQKIISCSHAMADYAVQNNLQGAKVFIMGEFGEPCFAEAAGLIPCRDLNELDDCALVIAGEGKFDWHDTFQAVMNYFIRHRERKLIVPNPDSYWPFGTSGKMGIGAGAQARFIAGLLKEMQIEIELVYLGKPHRPIFDCALKHLQQTFGLSDLQPQQVLMVGDALFADIAGARNAGLQGALVMTGVTTREILSATPAGERPELIFESIG
jgi:HAD superfamily hydrolase (TIGR01450 family)